MHTEKILSAINILERELKKELFSLQLNSAQGRAKIVLNEGTLYLQYNKFGEYGYQIVFSEKENDQARFDNYDAHWNVKTKPHHFHPRWNDQAFESPMEGNPDKDMALLSNLIKTKKIWNEKTRF